MKTVLRIVKYALISIYAICGIMLVVFLVPQTGWKALNVATSSMTPAIPQGSLVIIHHVNPHTLKSGDVVTFINPYNTKQTITHRIVEVGRNGQIIAFTTKGDANQATDKQILGGNVVGQVVFDAPKLGQVLSWAKQPLGLLMLIIIPGVLIIVGEIRLMIRKLGRDSETKNREGQSLKPTKSLSSSGTKDCPSGPPGPTAKKRPSIDGLAKSVAVVLMVVAVSTGVTRASLTSTASLTGNTISTAVMPNTDHIVINRVFIGGTGTGGAVCPELTSNATITNSNGVNSIIITNNCHIHVTNHTNIDVDNSNDQSSSSGDASNSSNTTGGSATSGDASNTNSSNTNVDISNGGHRSQWIQLYNPTNATVRLTGWKIGDDSGIVNTLPARTLRSHHSLYIRASRFGGQFGDGLDPAGDRLTLKNPTGTLIDAVSWGSDITGFNPALPIIPAGSVAQRVDPSIDTNTAGDWEVVSP